MKNKASKITHRLCTECYRGKRLERNTTSTRSILGGSSFQRRIELVEIPLDKCGPCPSETLGTTGEKQMDQLTRKESIEPMHYL